jgi:hypothetical protein
MYIVDTQEAWCLLSPDHLQVEAEDSGPGWDGQDRTWVHRVLSAIARCVWPEPLSTVGATPYIDAPPKQWPEGEPSRWWPDQ